MIAHVSARHRARENPESALCAPLRRLTCATRRPEAPSGTTRKACPVRSTRRAPAPPETSQGTSARCLRAWHRQRPRSPPPSFRLPGFPRCRAWFHGTRSAARRTTRGRQRRRPQQRRRMGSTPERRRDPGHKAVHSPPHPMAHGISPGSPTDTPACDARQRDCHGESGPAPGSFESGRGKRTMVSPFPFG